MPTPASARSMWIDFALVEKDLKTLVVVGVDREKMCISTRRGRGSSVYFVEDKRNPSEGS